MRGAKKKTLIDWIAFLVVVLIIAGGSLYYVYFFIPKNSIELYQELHFADGFNYGNILCLGEGKWK
ncbi:hypothetical protein QGM71_20190 [Virgibacillus sp. C22-A2]|uniref:Uncharacterized protein n=1 Tax=Virgibacillus tibetensis TaxID=3042313 RepID=A0ABU6KLL5_9BACI|nr:hypothetical protein [Virgibacillus sp. C22-A2]